jgi:hypothetical protein
LVEDAVLHLHLLPAGFNGLFGDPSLSKGAAVPQSVGKDYLK